MASEKMAQKQTKKTLEEVLEETFRLLYEVNKRFVPKLDALQLKTPASVSLKMIDRTKTNHVLTKL